MVLTLLLSACCDALSDGGGVTRIETYGGGSAAIVFHGTDAPLAEGESFGVTTEQWEGNFADGQSGLATSVGVDTGEDAPDFREGTVYLHLAFDVEAGDCGPATAFFESGLSGAELHGGAHLVEPYFAIVEFGRAERGTLANLQILDAPSGAATFDTIVWDEDAEPCLATFQPTGVSLTWAFDAAPIATDEFQGSCE